MRSYVLAKELGMDHAAVLDLLDEATACGLLFACDVLVEGFPPGKEYRPGCGLPAVPLSRREFTINPRKGQPWRREVAAPPSAPKTSEAATTKESAAEILNNEIEQENTMPTPREAAAKQLAHSLQVTKAIPARRSKSMARTPKVVSSIQVNRTSAAQGLIGHIVHSGPVDTVDLGRLSGVPYTSISKILSYSLKIGTIVNRQKKRDGIKGNISIYATPEQAAAAGWTTTEAKTRNAETKAQKTGTKVQKTVTPSSPTFLKKLQSETAKLQRKTAKAQPSAAKSQRRPLPATVDAAVRALSIPEVPFRCGVFSDGSMMLAGDFETVTSSGVVMTVTLTPKDSRSLVEYLRRLDMLEATA